MSRLSFDGWTGPGTNGHDRRMIDIVDDELAPPGKKWECCAACQGTGKVLVDVLPLPSPRTAVTPEPMRRYCPTLCGLC